MIKDAIQLITILMLGLYAAVSLYTEHFIAAGFGFVVLCGYVFQCSESEPDDPEPLEEDEEP